MSLCNSCSKCFILPSTATGDLANAPIKAIGTLGTMAYLRLDKKPQDALVTDIAAIAEISAYLAGSPTFYDCDTMALTAMYTLEVGDLLDEKVKFTFTNPDGTTYEKTVDFSLFMLASEFYSSDQSVKFTASTDDTSPNGPNDKKLDVVVNVLTVEDYICIDLGAGKKAWGKKSYNVKYGDATKTPITGSELYTVLETGDSAILATGTFAALTQSFVTLGECMCSCINYTF